MKETMTCASCKETIVEKKHIKAMDKFYHEEHFNCAVCSVDLSEVPVYTREDDIYCESDFKAKFLAKCAQCSQYIEDDCLKAMERMWHPEHFQCTSCQTIISSDMSYRSKDCQPYCEACYAAAVLPKCDNCSKPILDRVLSVKDFNNKEEQHFCSDCYHNSVLPKCARCTQPITDKALKAFDKQWHVGCFVCVDCKTTFEGSRNFYSLSGQPICGPCAGVKEE